MPTIDIRPNHKAIREYYDALGQFSLLHATHEGAVSGAFANLLSHCAKKVHWTLVPQFELRRRKEAPLRVDGALVDPWSLVHGYWEAKDERDDLSVEAKKKILKGYPTDNILFQAPNRAILFQNARQVLDEDISKGTVLVEVLKEFFGYQPPELDQWERAVEEFRDEVPNLARALLALIDAERNKNPVFAKALMQFVDVCRRSLNPGLSEVAVEKMLAQHILTERIFRTVFDNPDFVRRNAVAAEIERVVDALTQRKFNRHQFLAGLDRFYKAIEETASTIGEFADKQHFLNTVYEKFFQGFDAKTADTHGIVYTPQSIVTFMVRSVDEVLKREFGLSLAHQGVHVLDPFVGTGNFIIHVMQQIPKIRLPEKYGRELHANEVMLLPYYIASMNIEHEYAELIGEYKPFDGLCLVDTFELAEPKQRTFAAMTEKNAERVEQQRSAPITVVIGNPPYNAWQADENDKNKNREYPVVGGRVADTYARDSSATLVNSLSDPYVKAFRWASDRIGDEGVVAFVSNSSYVTNLAFNGMRKHLARDFDRIYVLDLGGNVRTHPKLSGTTHNVFGIQVGVAIAVCVRRRRDREKPRSAEIFYAATGEEWRKEQKYGFLERHDHVLNIEWAAVQPDANCTWLTQGLHAEFGGYLSIGTKTDPAHSIFRRYCNGAKSNNDAYVYSFDGTGLSRTAAQMVDAYGAELDRWKRTVATKKLGDVPDVDSFLRVDEKVLKWIRKTKKNLKAQNPAAFAPQKIRSALYRPYCRQAFFFDSMFNEDLYQLAAFFPSDEAGRENRAIVVSDKGWRSPFSALMVSALPDLHLCASTDAFQVFPFYTYGADGSRAENISDSAVTALAKHYGDKKIGKWDVFHYVYGILHHPEFRRRFAANLKRELPRVPFAEQFWPLARAGRALAELHVGFNEAPEYPLILQEDPSQSLDWRVERMRFTKDKKSIVYNAFLTLSGIPEIALEYRLGNRSALDWVIDQYQVSTDKRSGITNDPNRSDDPEAIVRLIKKVVTVSVETVKIVRGMRPLAIAAPGGDSDAA